MPEDAIVVAPLFCNETLRHFLAGSASGMISKYIEYPADTVKVRLQTESGRFSGSLQCIVDTYRARGFTGLYKGISAPLACGILENAFGFSVYSYACALLNESDPRTAPISTIALGGCACGGIVSFIQTPLELVKCRMQSGLTQVQYRGTMHCLSETVKTEGLKGVFRGHNSTLLRQVPGCAMFFVSYEVVVRALTFPDTQRGSLPIMLAGCVGGLSYWLTAYPADVVKSRQQTGHPGSFVQILLNVAEKEGCGAFFKGLPLTLARAAPTNAIIFLVYEYALKYLP